MSLWSSLRCSIVSRSVGALKLHMLHLSTASVSGLLWRCFSRCIIRSGMSSSSLPQMKQEMTLIVGSFPLSLDCSIITGGYSRVADTGIPGVSLRLCFLRIFERECLCM